MTNLLLHIRRNGLIESAVRGLSFLKRLLLSKVEICWLRFRGYNIDFSVKLGGGNVFFQSTKKSIRIGKGCTIGYGVKIRSGIRGSVNIADDVAIYDSTMVDIQNKLEIGRDALIAPFCYIVDYDHVTRKKDTPIIKQGFTSKPIIIGKNVWIGVKTIVLKGVHIGDNSMIGAGSVVTRDIPANSVAVGVPARVIKKR